MHLKNINNPPTIASITNSKSEAKKGEGKFNKVKQALKAKDDSYIPPDKQIQEVIEQIPHDKAQESLIYAIRSVDIPRIASLPKLFEAARKKEGQFWEAKFATRHAQYAPFAQNLRLSESERRICNLRHL